MIEIKPRYRVRMENALIHSGACAIDVELEAASAAELQDRVIDFMNTIGVRSSDFEIKRLHPSVPLYTREIILVGCHWRTEEITRVETHRDR